MFISGTRELAVLNHASRSLDEARSLKDVKAVRDKAEAARTYIRAAQLGLDLQNQAAELKLRAERKAGEFLGALKLRGGDRRSKGHCIRVSLEDLGISRQQSKRWQAVASVSETEFLAYLHAANEHGREITSVGLLRLGRNAHARTRMTFASFNDDGATISGAHRRSEFAPFELMTELMNHRQLLADVLRPVYQGGPIELKTAERRIVGRLLEEIGQLIRQLNQEWSRSNGLPI